MRTQAVLTNLTCNQNCGYCNKRAEMEDPAFVRPQAVRARIDDAIRSGVEEIVLTGGEPTLRRDIVSIVKYATSQGERRVVLETNATLVDRRRAAELCEAGVSFVRVNLSGFGDELDDLTRDPGGYHAARQGLAALLDEGVNVEISLALVRPTLHTLPQVIEMVAELDQKRGRIQGIVVRVPLESPDPSLLISFSEAATTIVTLEALARKLGWSIRMSPEAQIPPCVFPPKSRITHLYSMTRGVRPRAGMHHIEACESCQVANACLGFSDTYIARFGVPTVSPIADDRTRRRLTIITSLKEQMQREFVTPNRSPHPELGMIDDDIIRVQFHCNQSCRFCFVSTHLPAMDDTAIRAAIENAGKRGVKITLSGGEPTLNPRLVDYVRLAAQVTRFPIQLQSNAIRLDDRVLAEELVHAGVGEAFISLHGTTAEISDAITEAPGTFARTVVGIDNLHATDVALILNFVICERNMSDLPNMVRLVAQRWPTAQLNISFVAPSSDVVPRDRAFIPRYGDALPFVAEAVNEARRLGVSVTGFDSMCGIPLCLVPTSLDEYFSLSEIPPGFDRGEFVKTSACQDCDLRTRCYGLRTGYRELHGDAELRPVRKENS